MTHTKSNVVQYNEYYPFGLQTANSWTRENTTGNNFLGNGGTELNATSQLYDLDYRNYDPILGRMNGVDPMATKYASVSPYNFAFNDPVTLNDPSGADPYTINYSATNSQYYTMYTYDDRIDPTNLAEAVCGQCWRNSEQMAFLGAATGYGGSMAFGAGSWQANAFGGIPMTRFGQMNADAQAVRDGTMSVGDYASLYGSNPSSSDLNYIAGKLGLTITGTGNGNLYSTFVMQAAIMDGQGNHLAMQVNGVSAISLGIGKDDVRRAWREARDVVSKTREFLSDGVWQVGFSGTASAGLIGLSIGTGLVIDLKDGFDVELYFTLEHAVGADLSFGRVITYNKPTEGQLRTSSLRGWGESYNLGVGAFDASWGGDSFWVGMKNLLKFSDTHPTYNSYSLGHSPTGLPLGFTHKKGFTWVSGD